MALEIRSLSGSAVVAAAGRSARGAPESEGGAGRGVEEFVAREVASVDSGSDATAGAEAGAEAETEEPERGAGAAEEEGDAVAA